MQYIIEQLIVKMKFKEGLSYKAAVSKLKQTGELTPYNYKKALESKNTPTMSTPKIPKFTTENKFNALQMEEDLQSDVILQDISQKSPKRKSKRSRDSNSEEEISHKLHPKQKPKSRNESIEVHKVVAEIHENKTLSMDDTIIFTREQENFNVQAGETASTIPPGSSSPLILTSTTIPNVTPLEPSMPTVMPPESTVPVEPSESIIAAAKPSKSSIPDAIPVASSMSTVVPSKAIIPTVLASEASLTTLIPSEPPVPPVELSESSTVAEATPEASTSIVLPSDASVQTVKPSELTLPTHGKCSQTISAAETCINKTKIECQEKRSEEKSKETKKARVAKVANINTSKNISTSKGQSKKSKTDMPEPPPKQAKNLIRDYHMPPGYKGGK